MILPMLSKYYVVGISALVLLVLIYQAIRFLAFKRSKEAMLFRCVRTGDAAGVAAALKSGANPDAKDFIGKAAIDIAIHKANIDLLLPLLDGGANKYRAVQKATTVGEIASLECILTTGVSMQARNDALCKAISNSAVDLVSVLLKHGADPNARTTKGWPMLYLAAEQGTTPLQAPSSFEAWERKSSVVILLLEAGASLESSFSTTGGRCTREMAQLVKEVLESQGPRTCDLCQNKAKGISFDFVVGKRTGINNSNLSVKSVYTSTVLETERNIFLCENCLRSRGKGPLGVAIGPLDVAIDVMSKLYPGKRVGSSLDYTDRIRWQKTLWLRQLELRR